MEPWEWAMRAATMSHMVTTMAAGVEVTASDPDEAEIGVAIIRRDPIDRRRRQGRHHRYRTVREGVEVPTTEAGPPVEGRAHLSPERNYWPRVFVRC